MPQSGREPTTAHHARGTTVSNLDCVSRWRRAVLTPLVGAPGAAFILADTAAVLGAVLLHPGPTPAPAAAAVVVLLALVLGAWRLPYATLPPWALGAPALLSFLPYAVLHLVLGAGVVDQLPLLAVGWLALFGTRTQVWSGMGLLAVQLLVLPVPAGQVVTGADRLAAAITVLVAGGLALAVSGWTQHREAESQRHAETGVLLTAIAAVTREVRSGRSGRAELCTAVQEIAGIGTVLLFERDDAGGLTATTSTVAAAQPLTTPSTPGTSTVAEVFADRRRRFAANPLDLATTSRELVRCLGAGSVLWEPVLVGRDVAAVLVVSWGHRVEAVPPRAERAIAMLVDELAALLQRESVVARLTDSAMSDPLTGLPNRRVWDARAADELTRSARTGTDVVVAVLDLDHFKLYNDRHGHPRGDTLLAEFAQRAGKQLRRGDVLIRWGGEEFVALLPNCRLPDAVRTVGRLRTQVPDGQTCSAGLALWDGTEDAAVLLARADRALYRAKSEGRDRLSVDEPAPPERPAVLHRERARGRPA